MASPMALWIKIPPSAGDTDSIPGSGILPGGENGNPFLYFLLEKSHEQRSLAGYSPKDHKALDATEMSNNEQWLIVYICQSQSSSPASGKH